MRGFGEKPSNSSHSRPDHRIVGFWQNRSFDIPPGNGRNVPESDTKGSKFKRSSPAFNSQLTVLDGAA